jgi:hypothetical protein
MFERTTTPHRFRGDVVFERRKQESTGNLGKKRAYLET